MDAVLYLQDRDHVLAGKENGVVGTSNLLEMVPGVLEGQTSGDLFLNSIFDPSVIGTTGHTSSRRHRGAPVQAAASPAASRHTPVVANTRRTKIISRSPQSFHTVDVCLDQS